MSIDPARLIAALGSGVVPDRAARASSVPSVEHADFDQLLQQARTGAISSGRGVTVHPSVEITLDVSQASRLSVAADQAEAEGASTALVLVDDVALKLDVLSRQVTEAVDLNEPGVMGEIDAVIRAPGSGADPSVSVSVGSEGMGSLALPGVGRVDLNPSLLSILSELPKAS